MIGVGIRGVGVTGGLSLLGKIRKLFANGEQGAWYDPSDVNVNWRRNLLTYTEQFDNAAWVKEGTTTALSERTVSFAAGGASTNRLRQVVSVASRENLTWALSITVPPASGWSDPTAKLFLRSSTSSATVEITPTQAEQRVVLVESNPPVGTTVNFIVYANKATVVTGIWGAQLEVGSTATPYQRIVTPEITYAADVQTQPVLFQDSAGTTPVTALEQPVGLMLDKRLGLVLGSELVTNGDFSNGSTNWTLGSGWTISGGVAERTNIGAISLLAQTIPLKPGSFYRISFDCTVTSGSITATFGGGTTVTGINRTVSGAYFELLAPITGNLQLRMSASTNFAGSIDNISVRELPGNHAFQSTAASRPVLSARYNLLTKTEQFDDAVWTKSNSSILANATTAPDGTLTADKLVENTATSTHEVFQSPTVAIAQHTYSVFAKAGERSWIRLLAFQSGLTGCFASFNLATGQIGTVGINATASISSVGNGWFRCSITYTTVLAAVCSHYLYCGTADGAPSYAGDGASGIFIWGADLRVSNDGVGLPAYQRVNTATDYDSTGFPLYLRADGVDDGMVTNSIDFTATDKMTVVAGVRKLSDAAFGAIAEISLDGSGNNGAFSLASAVSAGANYRFLSRGTASSSAQTSNTFAAPITNVITGVGDISGDVATLRANGTQAASSTTDQGTGNFGNYPLYLFRRGGTTLPFNGRFYGLVVRGAQSSAAQITAAEQWMNQKTRAY